MKGLFAIVVLISALFLNGCAGCQQDLSHLKSKWVGLNRTVTLYSAEGKVLDQWNGRFQVEVDGASARFIDNGKAVTIAGTWSIIEN